jgi:hypothetical protein
VFFCVRISVFNGRIDMLASSEPSRSRDPNKWRDRAYEFCRGVIEGLPRSSAAACVAAFAAVAVAPDNDDDPEMWLPPRPLARKLGRVFPLLAAGVVMGGVAVAAAAFSPATALGTTFNDAAGECAASPDRQRGSYRAMNRDSCREIS